MIKLTDVFCVLLRIIGPAISDDISEAKIDRLDIETHVTRLVWHVTNPAKSTISNSFFLCRKSTFNNL